MSVPDVDPLVSIVVLNYNGKKHLGNCISSVLENAYPNFEVVLVDNASTDGSIEPIRERCGADPRLQIIQSNVNLGYSGGNNLGLSHSKGTYIVFLNNDTTVEPDWLIRLVEAMEHDSTIGIAQSLIYSMDKKSIQSAGWVYSDYLIKKYALCADKPATLQFKPVFDVSFVCGATMIIQREILDKLGAFEPSVPFFYDDTLLTLKTRLLGKRAVTVSASRMCHASGATNVWKARFTTYNLHKANNILIFDVFYSTTDLISAAILNIVNTAGNAIFNIAKRNNATVLGNLDAFFWTLRNFRFIWQNRLKHWSKTAVSAKQLKNGFVRVNVPVGFYLFQSQTQANQMNQAICRYEKTILKY